MNRKGIALILIALSLMAATIMATISVFYKDSGSDENTYELKPLAIFSVSIITEEPVKSMVVTLGFPEPVKIINAYSTDGNAIKVTELGNNSFKFSTIWKGESINGTLATIEYSVYSSKSIVEPIVLESKVRDLGKISEGKMLERDFASSDFGISLNHWIKSRANTPSINLVDIKLEIQKIEVI